MIGRVAIANGTVHQRRHKVVVTAAGIGEVLHVHCANLSRVIKGGVEVAHQRRPLAQAAHVLLQLQHEPRRPLQVVGDEGARGSHAIGAGYFAAVPAAQTTHSHVDLVRRHLQDFGDGIVDTSDPLGGTIQVILAIPGHADRRLCLHGVVILAHRVEFTLHLVLASQLLLPLLPPPLLLLLLCLGAVSAHCARLNPTLLSQTFDNRPDIRQNSFGGGCSTRGPLVGDFNKFCRSLGQVKVARRNHAHRLTMEQNSVGHKELFVLDRHLDFGTQHKVLPGNGCFAVEAVDSG